MGGGDQRPWSPLTYITQFAPAGHGVCYIGQVHLADVANAVTRGRELSDVRKRGPGALIAPTHGLGPRRPSRSVPASYRSAASKRCSRGSIRCICYFEPTPTPWAFSQSVGKRGGHGGDTYEQPGAIGTTV